MGIGSIATNLRMMNLIRKIGRASTPEDERRLTEELRQTLVQGRERARRRTDMEAYAHFSTMLGQYYLSTEDGTDALRPFGCAYVTACIVGDELTDERVRAGEGLVDLFASMGQFGFAAESAVDVVSSAGGETDDVTVHRLVALVLRAPRTDEQNEQLVPLYDAIRDDLREAPEELAALSALIEWKLGVRHRPYRRLVTSVASRLLTSDSSHLGLSIQSTLAGAALEEGLFEAARRHIGTALDLAERDNESFWLRTSLLGLRSEIEMTAGRPSDALDHALDGWSYVLPAQLVWKDDYARGCISRLADGCVDVAIMAAHELGDWPLLAELIENSRLQIAPGAQLPDDDTASTDFPDWTVDRFVESLRSHPTAASQQAILGGDWKSRLASPIVVTNGESRRLFDESQRLVLDIPRAIEPREAFGDLRDRLRAGAVVWSATVRRNVLYWTLTDGDGTFSGGSVDLDRTSILPVLARLRTSLLGEGDEPNATVDVGAANFSVEGSLDELEISQRLAALVPPYVRSIAAGRSGDDPLTVLFGVPQELSVVPWAVLPLDGSGVRLVERVELIHLTPTAVRTRSTSQPPPDEPTDRRMRVSVCDPGGNLRPYRPVDAVTVFDGNPALAWGEGRGVTLETFVDHIDTHRWLPGDVLFVRSHLRPTSNAGHAPDFGVEFADQVLDARSLTLRMESGEPVVPMPHRVVLALCSGSGSARFTGLALGLAAVCRLAGSEEVLTSSYNVSDTRWACELDHRIADAAVRSVPLSTALRELQLECLDEWRAESARVGSYGRTRSTPLIWAAYGVFV